MTHRMLSAAIMLLLALGIRAATNEPAWKAGVSSVVITPDRPMWMAGYANRTNVSQGTESDLFAKALALDDNRGSKLVIITLDLIGIPKALRTGLETELAKTEGLPRQSLLMNCSHTHSGPEFVMGPGQRDWAMFGKDGTPGAKPAQEYGRELQAKLVDLVHRAFQNAGPASLSYQHARCGVSMNRRTLFGTNYNNFPNPDGPVDQDVPVLRVDGADGKLKGVVFGYACHNTTVAFYRFCGDYAGYAQQSFEAAHPGVVALFMQGCGGDQNPYPRGTFELAQQHGRSLATSVEAALQTRPRALPGPLRLAYEEVDIAYDHQPTKAEFTDKLQSTNPSEVRHARLFLDRLEKGEKLPSTYPFPVQVIQFGDDLTLAALAGETVVGYSLRLKRESTRAPLWVAGYCNDVMSYIPTAQLLREGGYEPHTSMFYSEIHPVPWASSVEDRIVAKVHALDKSLRP